MQAKQLGSQAAPKPSTSCVQQPVPIRSRFVCDAGKGAKYFENFKRNRAPHEGELLPRPQETVSLLPLDPLLEYLEQEIWAYTTGQPSPTQALAGRPLGAKPSLQELLAEEAEEEGALSGAARLQALEGAPEGSMGQKRRGKQARPGMVIPPPAQIEGPGTHPPPVLKGKPYLLDRAQVHVYWDVESHHPGASDPRVLAHRIRSFASCYGQVAGVYAYAVRKAYNWVPEAFLRQAVYVDPTGAGDPGHEGKEDEGGYDGVDSGGVRQRCRVCGAIKRSMHELASHMRVMHPWAVTPSSVDRSGPGAVGAGQRSTSRDTDFSKSRPSITRDEAGSASSGSVSTISTASANGGGRLVARNTSRRTLGRVLLYHNALGQARVPPVGHQLSLKYSLMQEGVEARIVQNSAERASSAVTNGMNRLLDRMRRGEISTDSQIVVIAISDDEERIQKPLLRLRGIGGAATVAVCSSRFHSGGEKNQQGSRGMQYRGADCVASWELVSAGAYACPGPTQKQG